MVLVVNVVKQECLNICMFNHAIKQTYLLYLTPHMMLTSSGLFPPMKSVFSVLISNWPFILDDVKCFCLHHNLICYLEFFADRHVDRATKATLYLICRSV